MLLDFLELVSLTRLTTRYCCLVFLLLSTTAPSVALIYTIDFYNVSLDSANPYFNQVHSFLKFVLLLQ